MHYSTVSFFVTQCSDIKSSKNTGMLYMHVFGENDEEEPLKLNIWGKAATDKFKNIVKPGGVSPFHSYSNIALHNLLGNND